MAFSLYDCDYADGSTPSGSSAYEKRGIAVDIPIWQPDNCIQCNRCAYVCPHAVIRPVALTEEEAANAPEGMQSIPMIGMPDMKFSASAIAWAWYQINVQLRSVSKKNW